MSFPHAATHSSLDIFQKYPTLVNFKASNVVTYYPYSAVNGPALEFTFETGRNVHTDLTSIDLHLGLRIKREDGNNLDDTADNACFVNNALHSVFSDYEIYLNNERVDASSNYGHKAQIITEMSHTGGEKDTVLECQGYTYEDLSEGMKTDVVKNRVAWTQKSVIRYFKGRLLVDLFQCPQLLLPNVLVRIRLRIMCTKHS